MSKVFNILHVEDSCDDAHLVRLALKRGNFPCSIRCVDTEPGFIAALATAIPDAILCDYNMPSFSAERALAILREKGLDLPFIVVSHHVGSSGVNGIRPDAGGWLAKRDLAQLPQVIATALERGRAMGA
jgi:CheY-like chemotaxis protein